MKYLVSIWLSFWTCSVHAIEFESEIIPVLTKAGCNAGACHGAATGRGGFHLSLLGSNPTADYEAMVHDLEGRRTNRSHPETSLIFAKPTGRLDHGGSVALDEGGPGAAKLLQWIRMGVPRGESRQLTEFKIEPQRYVGVTFPTTVRIRAFACFDNGSPTDVSDWTLITSSDTGAIEIDDLNGEVVAHIHRGGQHVLVARFLNRVVPIQFNIPFSDELVDLSAEPHEQTIDAAILRVLNEMRIPVSPTASPSNWLRRVTLDLTGRLPELATAEEIQTHDSPQWRHRYVDRLLSSKAFSVYWTLRFSKWLRMHSLPNEKEGIKAYSDWLHHEIKSNTGLDRMARQLLTATGDSHEIGPANFGRMVSDAREHAELVGQFFLGVQIGCANCHNHPLDKWTQDDYHGLAAIFSKMERGREVRLTTRGSVTNLRTNQPAIPRIPGARDLQGSNDHRQEVAAWLTSDENRYFAKTMVNRLWQAMFGRGLVEPTNDLRETNPPTHPELLNQLAEEFATNGYSIRYMLRKISLANTYARDGTVVRGNSLDDRFYSRSYQRPLMPEVLNDAIADVTGVANDFQGHPFGTRAITIIDPLEPIEALDVLGRCSIAKGCNENSSKSGGLPAQLHLLNGDLLNLRLTNPLGRLQRMIAEGNEDNQMVQEFYMRAIARNPTDAESRHWCEHVKDSDAKKRTEKLEDFVWSLLNSSQFLENH